MTIEDLPMCQWPQLAEPYHTALRQAVTYILTHYQPVGLLACGSILRGEGSPNSDLDLYVLHAESFRQRVQKFFNGVPAEIFINPPGQVQRYLEEEAADGRPITAHMLANGFVVLENGSILSELRQAARARLEKPPEFSPQALTIARYMAAAQLEDALDVCDTRPETAELIMGLALHAILRYRFLQSRRFVPRDKDMLLALAALDAPSAADVQAFFHATNLNEKRERMEVLGQRILGVTGFFEWQSEPQIVA